MDRIFNVARSLWDEPYLTKKVANDIHPLFYKHRIGKLTWDKPWYEFLGEDSEIYKNIFTVEDYRWFIREHGKIFNTIITHKKDGVPINWIMFRQLIQTAAQELSGSISLEEANKRRNAAVEAVHPSGIEEIMANIPSEYREKYEGSN